MRGLKIAVLWWGCLGGAWGLSAQTQRVQDTYDFHLNEGLKSEALKNWADAVGAYMRAIGKKPDATLPRERILSIFKSLKSKKESTQALELLIDADVRNSLVLAGVFQVEEQDQSYLKTMNWFFWGAALIVLMVIGLSLGLLFRKKQVEDDAEKEKLYQRSTGAHKRSPMTPKTDKPDLPRPKKDVKVTDQTRSEMTDLIAGVKTLTGAQARPDWAHEPKQQEAQIKALESSEVLQALAQTMLSDVTTEDSPQGKFSKLSLDASLVFDENDAPPDLEEVRKQNPKDPSIEDYLNRLAQKEGTKGSQS